MVAAGAHLLQAAESVLRAVLANQPLPWSAFLAPSWPGDAASTAVLISAIVATELVLLGFGRSIPARALSSRSTSHLTDLFYCVASLTGLQKGLAFGMTLGASAAVEALTSTSLGFGWCSALPLWIAVPTVFVIGDFSNYWVHRFSHLPLMWPLHAIHHAANELTGLTSMRHQFISDFIGTLPYVLPAWALGFSVEAIAIATLLGAVQVFYAHTELPFPLWLERHFLMGVRLHRVHHARAADLHDHNFSGLVWWDKLFGTYRLIEDHLSVAVGIDDPRFDTGRPLVDCWTATAIWLRGLQAAVSSTSARFANRDAGRP